MQPFPISLFYTAMVVGWDSSLTFHGCGCIAGLHYCFNSFTGRDEALVVYLSLNLCSAPNLSHFMLFPSHLLSHFVTGESKWHDIACTWNLQVQGACCVDRQGAELEADEKWSLDTYLCSTGKRGLWFFCMHFIVWISDKFDAATSH